MKSILHTPYRVGTGALAALLLAALASLAPADPPPNPFEINWYTIDGGGNLSTSIDGYEVEGTIGQPDAGPTMADGSGYTIDGGYWTPGIAIPCLADFNNDGEVNPDDLGDFINCYFCVPPCPLADFNGDTNIDPDDLGDFINVYFGPPCT